MFWYQFSSYSYSLVRTVTGRCSADIRAANFREVSSTALVDMDGASKDVCRLVKRSYGAKINQDTEGSRC